MSANGGSSTLAEALDSLLVLLSRGFTWPMPVLLVVHLTRVLLKHKRNKLMLLVWASLDYSTRNYRRRRGSRALRSTAIVNCGSWQGWQDVLRWVAKWQNIHREPYSQPQVSRHASMCSVFDTVFFRGLPAVFLTTRKGMEFSSCVASSTKATSDVKLQWQHSSESSLPTFAQNDPSTSKR